METIVGKERVGEKELGVLFDGGKVRKRREWRGLKDTLYDYARWLYIMEDVYLSADYRSAWRPLKRENDLSAVNSPSDAGTSVKDTKIVDTFTNVNEMTLHNDVLQKVSEISADLDRLDRRLQEQDEKISNLLSLLEGKEGTGKKSVFGQQRK